MIHRTYNLRFEVLCDTEDDEPSNDAFMHHVNQGLPDEYYVEVDATDTLSGDGWGIHTISTDLHVGDRFIRFTVGETVDVGGIAAKVMRVAGPDSIGGALQPEGWIETRMIGDNEYTWRDPADVKGLKSSTYCRDCGQVGCGHGS